MFKRLFDYFTFGKRKIVQFGPIRSGSTLIFNLLKELFPNHKIVKVHNLDPDIPDKFPVVVTCRHPLDSLASSIIRFGLQPSEEVIAEQINKLKHQGLDDLLLLINRQNVLLLRYEDFYRNTGMILNGIEAYFNIKIGIDQRSLLIEKYQIKRVKDFSSKFKDFTEFDKETHWHGKHISYYEGKPGYYLEYFSERQLAFATQQLSRYLTILGYDKTSQDS